MKNKFFKKALSVFTAMAMALSLMTGIPFSELGLGITVSAEETTPDFSDAKVLTAVDGALCIDGNSASTMPAGNYKLTGDIATDTHIRTGGSINLDLNGYTWDMSAKYLFLNENVTFSLYDTSVNKTGKITSSSAHTIYLNGSGSTFNLYSGTVENTSDNVNAYGVSSDNGSSNLYGGTIKSNAYAVFYYLGQNITINIDNTSFDCGAGYAQICAFLALNEEPCAVIDVSDYTGGALTVDAVIYEAGEIKIFTGIQSAQDAENYKVNVSCDDNDKDFFMEKEEYNEVTKEKYITVSVPSFTTQPTEENDYTVAFNHPDATLQWCEVTVLNSATHTGEIRDLEVVYEVNAGDALIVSVSECSDDFGGVFVCSYNEERLYMDLDSSRKTASVTFDSACSVNVEFMPFMGTGEYKIEHVRYTELEGETDVQLSKTKFKTTYVCKATVGEREYCSDEVTIEHSYTCNATSDNVITKECANCGKSGTLTITAEGGVYDGTTAYGATVIKTGILENEEVTVNYYQGDTLIGTDAPVDVGTYTAKITYEEVTASVTYTIKTKTTPTADMFTYIESAVYDGTEKSANVVASQGITGMGEITVKYYQNDIEVTPVNAGTYTVKIDVADGNNYVAATDIEVGTFEITKATPPALTIPTATSITYGEKLSASTLSDGWAWVDGTIVPDAYTDCNAYIEVDDSNYDYTSVYGYDSANHRVVRDITVIINRATLTITANSYTIKVGSALPTYDYTVTGLVGDDTLPVDVTISCSATDSNAVGTYPITISGVVSDAPLASHYVINYANGTLTISEKDIQEIEADDVTLTYGETGKKITATTSGDGAISYSTTSDVISVAADGTITALKAGTATVTIKAAETADYAEATKTISVTVNKKKVAVPTADTTKYTYTGTAQTYGVTSTDDYTVEGGVQTNSGEYPVTITLNNENYEWDGTLGTYKFVINKAAVTVTAKSYTIKVGDTLPTYAYDVTGLVNGETLPIDVTISCNAADSNTAGTYTITVSGAANSTNYTFAYVNGTLTISNKLEQTITASDVTLTYGETGKKIIATTNGNGAISYSTTSDVISVAADGTITALKAGTATVTINVAETDTYAAATKTVTVTVNKAAVTITAKSYTIKVGEALPTYAYDVAGLVNGETLPIDVTISCNAADSNTAGTYDIIVSGAAASDNYTFSYVKGTLTVSEKEVVATPTFTPASGTTFTSSQKVTISCATAGAKIYYTTDGTEPTTASTLYNGAFTITTTTTIKAIAVKDGMTDSAVASITFTKNEYRPPVYPSYPIVTTTTTTTTTPAPVDDDEIIDEDIDDDSDDEDIEIDEDTDTTKPADDGDEPQIKGEDDKTGWDVIADEIADADDGDKIVVDMNGTTEVPEDILEQIQGQDIDLVIELDNGFTWTINGEDVTEPMDIDLGVNEGSEIPVKVINSVTDECEYITLTLSHNGDFGFKATLTVDMGEENEGLYANLYWYTDGGLEFVCANKISSKGKADLTFTHASEYIIVIDEENHGKRAEETDGSDVDGVVSEEDDANPGTGVLLCFSGIAISAAAVMITRKRKNK